MPLQAYRCRSNRSEAETTLLALAETSAAKELLPGWGMSKSQSEYKDIFDPHRLLPLLFENMRDYGLIVFDEGGKITEWSAGACEIFGFERDEIVGQSGDLLFLPEDQLRGEYEKELTRSREVGRADDTRWHKRRDGSRIFVQGTTSSLRDESGQLKGYAKVVRDLTRQRKAEDALRESEERFQIMVEKVKEYAVFMLDPDGNVATWNYGAERIKGYKAEEVIGKYYGMLYLPEDQEAGKPEHNLREALRKGTHDDCGPRLRKDGVVYVADVSITAIFDEERGHIGFTKVVKDVTRQVEDEKLRTSSEESLRRYSAEIEGLNERLRRAVTETHHRVKNNMQVVMALIDYQTMGKKEYVHVKELKRLKHHIYTLAAVHDTLAHGSKSLGADDEEIISARPLIEKLMKLLRQSAGDKELSYTVDEVFFRTKEITALCLIINELVSNAVKYGKKQIRVRLERGDGHTVLSVEDDGEGFPDGFDIERSSNIGLELVQSVVSSDLKGEFQFDRGELGGARVVVRTSNSGIEP